MCTYVHGNIFVLLLQLALQFPPIIVLCQNDAILFHEFSVKKIAARLDYC